MIENMNKMNTSLCNEPYSIKLMENEISTMYKFNKVMLKNQFSEILINLNLKLKNASNFYIEIILDIISKFTKISGISFITRKNNMLRISKYDLDKKTQRIFDFEEKKFKKEIEKLEKFEENKLERIKNSILKNFSKNNLVGDLKNNYFFAIKKNDIFSNNEGNYFYVIFENKNDIRFNNLIEESYNKNSFFNITNFFMLISDILYLNSFYNLFLFKNLKMFLLDFYEHFFYLIDKLFFFEFCQFIEEKKKIKFIPIKLSSKFNSKKNILFIENNNFQFNIINSKNYQNQDIVEIINSYSQKISCLKNNLINKLKIYKSNLLVKEKNIFFFNINNCLTFVNFLPQKMLNNILKKRKKLKNRCKIHLDDLFKSDLLKNKTKDILSILKKEKKLEMKNEFYNYRYELIFDNFTQQIEGFLFEIDQNVLIDLEINEKDIIKSFGEINLSHKIIEVKVHRSKKRKLLRVEKREFENIDLNKNPNLKKERLKKKTDPSIKNSLKLKNNIVKVNSPVSDKLKPEKTFILDLNRSMTQCKSGKFSQYTNKSKFNLEFKTANHKKEFSKSVCMEFMPQFNFKLNGSSNNSDFSLEPQKTIMNIKIDVNDFDVKIKSKEILFLKDRLKEEKSFLNNWNIDINSKDSNFLYSTVFAIFEPYINSYKIENKIFYKFIKNCHHYYNINKNTFHNFFHGVGVCYAANFFIQNSKKLSEMLTELNKFGFILAALGHDLEHTGRNNNFEIQKNSVLAMRYTDKSPLEFHHCYRLFSIIFDNEENILSNLKKEEILKLREQVIELILATDMKFHFHHMSHYKEIKENKKIDFTDEKQIVDITGLLLHSADLCHASKKTNVAEKCAKLVSKEFHAQFLEEEKYGFPTTPYFKDLDVDFVFYKSEMNFIKFIVKPLYEITVDFFLEINTTSLNNDEIDLKEEEEKEEEDINFGKFKMILNQCDKNMAYYQDKYESLKPK